MDDRGSLDDLAAFALVAEAGGFSAAARKAGLPLSTISRRVAALERALGAPLLVRTTRRVALTEAGARLLAGAGGPILAARAALASGAGPALSGRLRVSCPPWIARDWAAAALYGFVAENPLLVLDLVLTNGALDLVEGGIDLAIRAGPLDDSSMMSRTLRTAALAVFSATEEPPLPLAALAGRRCIVTPPLESWSFAGAAGAPARVRPGVSLRVNDLELAADAAAAGLGLAYLPESLGRARGLHPVEIAGHPPLPRPVVAVWPAGPAPAARTLALVRRLAEPPIAPGPDAR